MEYKDLGELLYKLKKNKGITELELLEKINMPRIEEKNIKKWERGLEYPDLETIYKLSEVFEISSTELLEAKQKSLDEGVYGIHKTLIRWISFFLGISIYSTIILFRIIIFAILVIVLIWFSQIGN